MLNSKLGVVSLVNHDNLYEFLEYQKNVRVIGSPSANSIVTALGNNSVLKIVKFREFSEGGCKGWIQKQFENARMCEKEIRKKIKQSDRSLETHFNLNDIHAIQMEQDGLVVETILKGLDFKQYIQKLHRKVLKNKMTIAQFEQQVMDLLSVITDIIYRMYALGINHNDLHDRNIFIKYEKCIYSFSDSNDKIELEVTPVIFDFDWSTIEGMKIISLYECVYKQLEQKCINKQFIDCMRCTFPDKIGDFNFQDNNCDFFNQHAMFSKEFQDKLAVSPMIDLGRFMLYFIVLLNSFSIDSFPQLTKVFKTYFIRNFDVRLCKKKPIRMSIDGGIRRACNKVSHRKRSNAKKSSKSSC